MRGGGGGGEGGNVVVVNIDVGGDGLVEIAVVDDAGGVVAPEDSVCLVVSLLIQRKGNMIRGCNLRSMWDEFVEIAACWAILIVGVGHGFFVCCREQAQG
jgi:hypothetical protein